MFIGTGMAAKMRPDMNHQLLEERTGQGFIDTVDGHIV